MVAFVSQPITSAIMKTVFKSDEIAHIWVNRGAAFGRSPGNLSFDGDAIKSYATVIGRRIEHGGKTAYVLDNYGFSITTSAAQSKIQQAIPDSAKVFHVHYGERGQSLSFTPVTLAKHYEDDATRTAEAMPSRYAHKRAEQYASVTASLESARDVLAYFEMGTARLDKKIAARRAGHEHAAETLGEYRTKLEAARKAKEARELKERTAKNVKWAEDYIGNRITPLRYVDLAREQRAVDTLPAELRARLVAAVEAGNARLGDEWRKGVDVSLPYDCPTMLRVEFGTEGPKAAQEMVTSHGARVPLAEAHRTYRFALICKAKGWHRNGETHAIGPYQLDAVNEQGVVAGCHRVTWAEIERFAAAQGWAKAK